MATIDINQYIEQSGMRKARFGGYEPDDVRQAMLDLCSDDPHRMLQRMAIATAAAGFPKKASSRDFVFSTWDSFVLSL